MDYVENATIEDCLELYGLGEITNIENGQVIGFEKGE